MSNDITALILAGGNSSRMGKNKALLPYGGTTLIERLINRLQPYTTKILLSVSNEDSLRFLGLPMIKDIQKNCGPLSGLVSGIAAVKTEFCCAVSCDLPYFSGAIIPLLRVEIGDADICIPVLNGYYEPLLALYRPRVLTAFEESLNSGKYQISAAFKKLTVKAVSQKKLQERYLEKCFYNLNTIRDYENLK